MKRDAGMAGLDGGVTRTRARAEKQVDRLLARAGVEAYLPLVELERTWADRKKRVLFPLSPGYTFVRALPEGLCDVVRTPRLVDVVGGLCVARASDMLAAHGEDHVLALHVLAELGGKAETAGPSSPMAPPPATFQVRGWY